RRGLLDSGTQGRQGWVACNHIEMRCVPLRCPSAFWSRYEDRSRCLVGSARCTQSGLLPHDLGSSDPEKAVGPHRFPKGTDEGLGDWRQVRRWVAGSCIEFALEHRPEFAGQGLLARFTRPPILPHVLDVRSASTLCTKRGDQASFVQAATVKMYFEQCLRQLVIGEVGELEAGLRPGLHGDEGVDI